MSRPPPRVALETTLLLHGVPREEAFALAQGLFAAVRSRGAEPALTGVFAGRPVVGLSEQQLREMLAAAEVPKVNVPNLAVTMHRRRHGATTVSATLELAASAGVRVFATGGLGGVHRATPPSQRGAGMGSSLDVSADLFALTRHPVAVVCSGVKSILHVEATREMLEALGVTVVGYRTNRFPAFYQRESAAGVDDRFDDAADLGTFLAGELARACRAVVVCNPVPRDHEIPAADWARWLAEAEQAAVGAGGRDATPAILDALHRVSGGATLRANIALVKANAELAAELAATMAG